MVKQMRIPDFEYKTIDVGDVRLSVASGGEGSPVVLLHGFPQTHLAWRLVAPELAKNHTVICPDLRGYGDSDKPAGDEKHETYSKRTMANDILRLVQKLGHDKFAVIGHDRGALVGFRLVLDHPEAVTHLAVMDVIPTVDMWQSLQGVFGVFGYHQFFLAQQPDFPERMIGAAPEIFFDHTLDSWCKNKDALPNEIRDAYVSACSDPKSIHAICEDYRAGAFVDGAHDTVDREADKQIDVPTLVLWQDPGEMKLPFDPLKTWQTWAPKIRGHAVACGHFLPEEKPDEVLTAINSLIQ